MAGGRALAAAEPGLGDGLFAFRQTTGAPSRPPPRPAAWAARAREAGAEMRVGEAVEWTAA